MEDLKEKLALHKEWLLGTSEGIKLDLSGANLSGANLSGANLNGADLRYCIGNGREIKSLQIGTYLISYTKDILNIGCQSHTYSDWRTFSDNIILDMDGKTALDWGI